MNKIHYNRPQIICALVNAQELYAVMGRGTGKSTGIIAPRINNCAMRMARSSNGLIGSTYLQILTRTLPATVSGWKKLGFREWDPVRKVGHFSIGKRVKEFPVPDEAPLIKWEHCIHWYNGSIVIMISQDRAGNANGLSLQSLHGDEAKMLDKDDLNENILPTLRGLIHYEHLPEYKSITFTTSMPVILEQQWILKKQDDCNQELIDTILQGEYLLDKWSRIKDKSNADINRIAEYKKLLNELRLGLVHYVEASSLDNIHILGPDYIKQMKRNLPDFVFRTEILNERPTLVDQAFYPQLSKKHFYNDYDYGYYDTLNFDIKEEAIHSKGDHDLNPSAPLEVCVDWGGTINTMIVCQEDERRNRFNILKEFFVLQPEFIDHLVSKFCNYYRAHTDKTINFYYDRNGNTRVANSDQTYAEQAIDLFEKLGWTVVPMIFEENPHHQEKYIFFNILMQENNPRLPTVRINEGNCPNLKISMFNAPVKQKDGVIAKDKSSERKQSIPKEQATHFSDCFDIIVFKKYRSSLTSNGDFIGIL